MMKFRRLLSVMTAVFIAVSGYVMFRNQVTTYTTSSLIQEKRLLDVRHWNVSHAGDKKREETKTTPGACVPRTKFVFIKTHKTGGCTVVSIFQRYALQRSLSVLTPIGGRALAWPFPPAEQDYVHAPDEQYDALMNHMTYNKTWLRSKFPPNTAYISIIRKPSSHLKSSMNYYHLPKLLKIKSKNPVKTFLQDPWRYKELSEAYFDFCNITWDGTRNQQAFDLGYPTEGAEDKEQAQRYISELEADFALVLILEHLDESVVLLRRLMCWQLADVLYDASPQNSRGYSYKSYVPTGRELATLRRWKAVDYLLYDTFNRSLWRKIEVQGPDFHEELRYFQTVKTRVSRYCRDRRGWEPDLTVRASKWSPHFVVDADYCHGLRSSAAQLFVTLKKRVTTKRNADLAIRRISTNILDIIRGKPTFKYNSEARRYSKRAADRNARRRDSRKQ